jgi:acyl carrier protein
MLQSSLEQEVARLIVEALQLDVDPAAIAPETPLFNTGLGLDSIDALELSLAISRRYGVELRADDEHNGQVSGSLRALAGYIDANRK